MCNSGLTFSVQVNGAANPFVNSTNYNDFVISIKEKTSGELIFISPTPLKATPDLTFGLIDNITVT